jgi:hypothetical protein
MSRETSRAMIWVYVGSAAVLVLVDLADTSSSFFPVHIVLNMLMLAVGLWWLYKTPRRPQTKD